MNNNKHEHLITFLDTLGSTQITLGTIPLCLINADHWATVFEVTIAQKYRLAGIWTEDLTTQLQITACLETSGEYILLRALVDAVNPKIASISTFYPAANRLERHAHDMFGIDFIESPDQRRWTRHQAWTKNQFPLRKNFPKEGFCTGTTLPDMNYHFVKAYGTGVYEIPVGPVHAGIIEPGHFRFQAAGEDVINLEEHLGYVHKGIEKIAEGRDINSLIKLAGRVSGDSTVAYAWATCRAYEEAYALSVPEKALFLRAIMLERERIANHLGDFAAICNDVGFSFAYYQFMRLKELWLRLNARTFKHRFMMDCIIPGGVACDINDSDKLDMQQQISIFKKELSELYPMIEENSSLHDRLKNTGILTHAIASSLGTLGYVGRASGCNFDLRRDNAHSPYDQFTIHVPVYDNGDVLSRTRVRAQEILVSLNLIHEILQKMPAGNIATSFSSPEKAASGLGLIEGWRGEILVYASFNERGLVERFFPRDPSWFSWSALEKLIHGNIVPDFPVCNKSVNGSYSGVDL
jgi:Ni,Fe-hydrogenase III large subunit